MAKQGRKKKGSLIPKDETKAERFYRVVIPRIGKAVKAIRVIGYCSGPTYEYSPAQVEQIMSALTKATIDLQAKFQAKPSADAAFDFKT